MKQIYPSKLELHYYLTDDHSHSIDAILRNECEKELLYVIKEITSLFDIRIQVESEAVSEGGFKETWKFIGKNQGQITLILGVLVLLWSRIPVENTELVELQKENLILDNQIKKAELRKIKNEIGDTSEIPDEVVERVLNHLEDDYKLLWHKSNFFKKINRYPKIKEVSTQLLDNNNSPISEEKRVFRQDFRYFIIKTDKVAPKLDEDAEIQLISPVLIEGNFSWKGFYDSQIINFEMRDKEFISSVKAKEVEFVNGIAIKCVLNQERKIDDAGIVQITKNQVLTVIEIMEGTNVRLTSQGNRYKKNKKDLEGQLKMEL